MRHTAFRFALDPTLSQRQALMRHAGASRFAYNQCLRLLVDALADRESNSSVNVPWSGFDLINSFNAWKRSEDAGRIFTVAADGTITRQVTGLAWRHEVSAQVFEEAAVDLGRALAAYAGANSGKPTRRRIGFPKPKMTPAPFGGCFGPSSRSAPVRHSRPWQLGPRCCPQPSSVTVTGGMSALWFLRLTSTQTAVTIHEMTENG
jgi:hypothetical protein